MYESNVLVSVIISCGCYRVCAVCLHKLISRMWTSNRIYSDPLENPCNCNRVTRTRSGYCGVACSPLYRLAAATSSDLVNYSYLFPLEPKYLPYHPSLEQPVPMFLPKFGELTAHPCITNDKVIVLYVLIFLFFYKWNKCKELKHKTLVNLALLDISFSFC